MLEDRGVSVIVTLILLGKWFEALALRHSNLHARFLPGGHYPQHSTPHVIARLVDEAVAELDAVEPGGRAAG